MGGDPIFRCPFPADFLRLFTLSPSWRQPRQARHDSAAPTCPSNRLSLHVLTLYQILIRLSGAKSNSLTLAIISDRADFLRAPPRALATVVLRGILRPGRSPALPKRPRSSYILPVKRRRASSVVAGCGGQPGMKSAGVAGRFPWS